MKTFRIVMEILVLAVVATTIIACNKEKGIAQKKRKYRKRRNIKNGTTLVKVQSY